MAQVCLPAGCVDAIRVSRVDDCTELPVPGPTSGYIFNCFRGLELTSNIEDGDEKILRNDCGRKCFQTKKCDELTNVTVAFDLLNPDYELTNLLTGQSLINDGLENIGWYQQEGLNCSPWVCVELFEQVPDEVCALDHKYRRLVIPKVRFKLPSSTREDPFRIVPFEGLSSPASLATWATGPFGDSPFDFSVVDPDVQTHFMEFFDSSITETLEGTCGFVEVDAFAPPEEEFFSAVYPDMEGSFEDPVSQGQMTLPGPQGDFCGPMGVLYVCSSDKIVFWTTDPLFFDPAVPDPATVDFVTDTGTFLDIPLVDHYTNNATVSMARVEDASSYGTHISNLTFRDTLGDIICSLDEPYGSWNGAPWLIGDAVCDEGGEGEPLVVTFFVCDGPFVVIRSNEDAVDLSGVDTIDWITSGGSGTATIGVNAIYDAPDIIMDNIDPNEELTSVIAKDGATVIGTWTGSELLYDGDPANIDGNEIDGGDLLANNIRLTGDGLLRLFTQPLDVNDVELAGSTLTLVDDTAAVVEWPSGEIVPSNGWAVYDLCDGFSGNFSAPIDSPSGDLILGQSTNTAPNPDVSVNPAITAPITGSVKILDINGVGAFDGHWDQIELDFGVNGIKTYVPADPEWTVTDGGNSITVVDPTILAGWVLADVTMRAPANVGFLTMLAPAGDIAVP